METGPMVPCNNIEQTTTLCSDNENTNKSANSVPLEYFFSVQNFVIYSILIMDFPNDLAKYVKQCCMLISILSLYLSRREPFHHSRAL